MADSCTMGQVTADEGGRELLSHLGCCAANYPFMVTLWRPSEDNGSGGLQVRLSPNFARRDFNWRQSDARERGVKVAGRLGYSTKLCRADEANVATLVSRHRQLQWSAWEWGRHCCACIAPRSLPSFQDPWTAACDASKNICTAGLGVVGMAPTRKPVPNHGLHGPPLRVPTRQIPLLYSLSSILSKALHPPRID